MIINWRFDAYFDGASAHDEFLLAAQELLHAHRSGHHLLVLDRRVAGHLLNRQLSAADLALVRRLHSEFTQTGRLASVASVHVDVVNSFTSVVNAAGSMLRVSLRSLRQSRILERPILLVENLARDGRTYSEIITVMAQMYGYGPVSFDVHHGGGNDIISVLQHLVADKRATYCIVDSDAYSPYSQSNTKLTAVREVIANSGWPFAVGSSPPCREVENLLPLDLVRTISSGIGNPSNAILEAVARYEESTGCSPDEIFWLYFDLKVGIDASVAGDLDPPEREWIEAKLAAVGVMQSANWSVEGYGERVMHQLLANGQLVKLFRQHIRTREWRSIFAKFFESVVWFFLSTAKLVT